MPEISYHPERARAVITTEWSGGYKPVVIKSIESYQIDTNMDQDSDSFNLAVGDPRNNLVALMNRDGEIRIQIFGVGLDAEYLFTGLVDDVEQTESGTINLSGRDRSCIAVDTMATAGKWKEQRADEFIKKRALGLGVTNKFKLAGQPVLKTIRQDGSETEWEFWYRLIRKEQMWLWFTSDGTLVASKLAGDGVPPTYFFGTAPNGISSVQARQYVPVEAVSFRKTTQTRVGEVELFYKGEDNKMHTTGPISDPTIREWEKRPLKYIEETHQTTDKKAIRTVYEEIFESKVGALEIKVTIPDLGFIIRSNRIARLRIPEIGLGGNSGTDWFVVGSTIMANQDGFTQEVRLREKNYAISKRVPDDPSDEAPPGGTSEGAATEEAECLRLADVACRPEWTQYLVNAARQYQSAVPYELYLAILMAIMEKEGCRNVRQSGDIEWFKWTGEPKHGITTKAEWVQTFKNDHGEGGGGVGPFQLTTYSYKTHADELDGGTISELEGNRWNPEWNIMTGAWVLTVQKGNNSLREENVWEAVKAYNGGGQQAENYMNSIKGMVYGDNGYLKKVTKALQACKEEGTIGGAAEIANGILIPKTHETDHCTSGLESFYAFDFMDEENTKVFIEESAKLDPSYGQQPHLTNWRDGYGGWTFQLKGDSGTQYWFTHLNEDDPDRYQGGKIPANGYVGRLTDSSYKAKLINGAHVHVGSPQWPHPPRGARGCPGSAE
jgi:prophage tail gpP-like protein